MATDRGLSCAAPVQTIVSLTLPCTVSGLAPSVLPRQLPEGVAKDPETAR